MGRYTDFTLYWEWWGGYPEREEPFGLPQLAWFIASADGAARCMVSAQPKDAMSVTWGAGWQRLPRELLGPVPDLLAEAGAFGQVAVPLVEDTAEGDYLEVWELSGTLHDRPFRLTVPRTVPGAQWTPLGRRLSDALYALYSYPPEDDRQP